MDFPIRHKFILSLFVVVVFSLGLSGISLFAVFRNLHDRHAREQVHQACKVLGHEIRHESDAMLSGIHSAAQRDNLVSSMNMISEYQSVDDYQPIIFDVEKKKIAGDMAEQAESARLDLIAVYNAKKLLTAFALKQKQAMQAGIVSYDSNGKAIIYTTSSRNGDNWIKSKPTPFLDMVIDDVSAPDKVVYQKVEQGISVEAFTSIIRTLPDGTRKTVGFIKAAHFFDAAFARTIAEKIHIHFSFLTAPNHIFGTFQNLTFSDQILKSSMLFADRSVEDIRWIKDEDYFLYSNYLPLKGDHKVWFVFGPEKTLLTDAIDRTALILAVVLFCSGLFMVIWGSFIANRMITQPVARLLKAVQAFKDGFYEKLEPRSRDEIGQLTESFNIMARTIQNREREIEDYRLHLEKMVETRTQALEKEVADHKKAQKELRQHNSYMEALYETFLGLIKRRNVSELLEAITGHVAALVECSNGFMHIYDAETDALEIRVGLGRFISMVGQRFKRGQGLSWKAFESGRVAVVADYANWGKKLDAPELDGLRACIVVPLKLGAGTIGLGYFDEDTRQFGSNEIDILTRFAELASIVLENARLWEEINHAKSAAEEANRAKSLFLAKMSHEIRTPMNAIMGMTELTLRSNLGKEQGDNLRVVKESARHLLDIINDILDLSKIESDKIVLEQIDFDLSDLVGSLIQAFSIQAKRKGLAMNLNWAPETPRYVKGDPLRLRQILANLLANALKFTSEGEIRLKVATDPSTAPKAIKLLFAVVDTGIGIPADRQEIIFESFTQASQATTRTFGGTGLGLSICKQLTELMGGGIQVESQPGQGSTFTFAAVFQPGDPSKVERFDPEPEQAASVEAMQPLSILLAEDNVFNADIAVQFLEAMGHRITTVANGEAALAALRENSYDLILMDVEMDVMDGLEATRKIRKGDAGADNRRIPVIAMTAHALPEYQQKCLDAGMDAFVTKPVDFDKLIRVIEKITHARDAAATGDQTKSDHARDAAATGGATKSESQQNNDKILNDNDMLDRLRGNRQMLAKLYTSFMQSVPPVFDALQQAVNADDIKGVAFQAHSLKGACRNIGAEFCSEVCEELELLAKSEERARIKPTLEAVAKAFNQVIDAMQRKLVDLEGAN